MDPNNGFDFSGGGGFSNYFPRPSYQDLAVSTFLNSDNLPPFYRYNAAGRAVPDVSANGMFTGTVIGGNRFHGGGTSASAPIFASIVNRINGERIKAGKSSLGFLNPSLYAYPEAFNDITTGYNVDCHLRPAFNATLGWDPVTGLGTPDFPKLLEVYMSLP